MLSLWIYMVWHINILNGIIVRRNMQILKLVTVIGFICIIQLTIFNRREICYTKPPLLATLSKCCKTTWTYVGKHMFWIWKCKRSPETTFTWNKANRSTGINCCKNVFRSYHFHGLYNFQNQQQKYWQILCLSATAKLTYRAHNFHGS